MLFLLFLGPALLDNIISSPYSCEILIHYQFVNESRMYARIINLIFEKKKDGVFCCGRIQSNYKMGIHGNQYHGDKIDSN